jgi:molybdenum cofactor cytidylyltransferase
MTRHKTVAGVILAAGGSKRMGVPKQLLKWNNQPLITGVIGTALLAELSPLYVVLGSHFEEIIPVIQKYPIDILINPEWNQGLSTSVSTALNALPNSVDGVLFLLSDQPLISTALIRTISMTFQRTDKPVVAPMVGNRRGNPVLFSRKLFDDLLAITGDSGGRSLLDRYPVEWVHWEDPSVLLDIDSRDDYEKLIKQNNQ